MTDRAMRWGRRGRPLRVRPSEEDPAAYELVVAPVTDPATAPASAGSIVLFGSDPPLPIGLVDNGDGTFSLRIVYVSGAGPAPASGTFTIGTSTIDGPDTIG